VKYFINNVDFALDDGHYWPEQEKGKNILLNYEISYIRWNSYGQLLGKVDIESSCIPCAPCSD
jgi:hypothetical protein